MESGKEPDSSERRKLRKIVVERRRRERIDRCLEHLRLILQTDAAASSAAVSTNSTTATNRSSPGFNDGGKLEKADILEQTVSYLHLLTQHRAAESARGYAACLREVDNFLDREAPSCKEAFRAQLLTRLHRQAGLLLPRTTTTPLNPENTPDMTSSSAIVDRKRHRKPLQMIENTRALNGTHTAQRFQGSGSSGRGLRADAVDVTVGGLFSSNHVTKRRCLDACQLGVNMSAGVCENQLNSGRRTIPRSSFANEPPFFKTAHCISSGVSKYDFDPRNSNTLRIKPHSRRGLVAETVSKAAEAETGSRVETETGSPLEMESEVIRVGAKAEVDVAVVPTVCTPDCFAEQEQDVQEAEVGRLSAQHGGQSQINDRLIDDERDAITPSRHSQRGIAPGISPGISRGISPDFMNVWRPW